MSYLGVVTQASPLMVRGDLSTTADPAVNSGGYVLAVGARVVLDKVGKQVFVFGVVGAVSVPTGCTMTWWTATAPTGWKILDGLAWSRATYAALFALWGTSFGVGDGSTTFGTPPVPGRSVVAKDASAEFDTLGETGGAKTHTLTVQQMPAHTHDPESGSYVVTGGTSMWVGDKSGFRFSDSSASVGGGQAHNNLPPYVVANTIVKT